MVGTTSTHVIGATHTAGATLMVGVALVQPKGLVQYWCDTPMVGKLAV